MRCTVPYAVRALGLVMTVAIVPATAARAMRMQDQPAPPRRVARDRIVAAMRVEQRKDYDITLTAFAARFQANVLFQLARAELAADSNGAPLFVHHADYFGSFLEVTGRAPAEAPLYLRISCAYGENLVVDYGNARVIRRVEAGAPPQLALSVVAGWRDHEAERYAYDDTSTSPDIRVIRRRTNSYHILEYDSLIVHDDIEGVGGRVTGGVLGLLFRLIGYGWATHTRIALAADGSQVVRASVRKGPFGLAETVTIGPDGRADKGVPGDRPDLRALERRLHSRLEIEYRHLAAELLPIDEPPAHGETDCGMAGT